MRVATLVPAALVSFAAAAGAAPGAGTLGDPLRIDAFPYALRSTTAGAPSNAIDSYACAPSLAETGPELVFSFELAAPARVSAWIEEAGSVDVDVHLLSALELSGTEATQCASRGNRIAEANLEAGPGWVVVDTYDGAAQAGEFVLHVDAIGDAWNERFVAEGVSWRARRYASHLGGPQVVHQLVVDTAASGVSIQAFAASGCQTVQAIGEARGAVAGVNGGYFGLGGGCPPVSLLKSGGQLLGTNGTTRGAFGIRPDGTPLIEIVGLGADWPAASEAHGGGPLLVVQGQPTAASDWAAEGFTSSGFNGENPRTFAGIDAEGRTLLGTVDGRRDNAAGMSLGNLASFLASSEVGAAEAVNLDGGGSSQMWIANATPNGVVNYPSDNSQAEEPTHSGARACSGGLFVFAPPYNHPPRFQTAPPTQATAGSDYDYDADAIDLDVDDVLSFALLDSPAGMTLDAVTGALHWTPPTTASPVTHVRLVVSDDRGAQTEQSFDIDVSGTRAPLADAGGAEGGPGQQSTRVSGDESGCGCRARAASSGGPRWPGALALLLAALCHRCVQRGRRRLHPSGLRSKYQ